MYRTTKFQATIHTTNLQYAPADSDRKYVICKCLRDYWLAFSNKLLQTLTYREYVKHLVRSVRRCSTSSTFSVVSIAALKMFTNQIKEYWYIGSTLTRWAVANRKFIRYNSGSRHWTKVLIIQLSRFTVYSDIMIIVAN